nr:MAG TPA: hypothetical protein [Caudoviricetes sp.]
MFIFGRTVSTMYKAHTLPKITKLWCRFRHYK